MWQKCILFFKKMGQSRPLFVYFRYFLTTISIMQIEKGIDGVLGIRTWGPQDGRRRRNHGAMAATKECILLWQTTTTPLWKRRRRLSCYKYFNVTRMKKTWSLYFNLKLKLKKSLGSTLLEYYSSRCHITWAGALDWWLWEETHVQEVVGLNPSTRYKMTFSAFKFC